jgi:N-hydroxyarylamine O-acetyltransferase
MNLGNYFKRIGYAGSDTPTLQTLAALHALHPSVIAFENLSPFLGVPVQLDNDSIEEKLVKGGRGGYCFEQNLLFWQVLEQIGFSVKGLASRVRWNVPGNVITPRGHMLLHVDVEGIPYIADVGFGGLTLTAPLQLEPDLEQPTPHETFRIKDSKESYRLQANVRGEWKDLYTFDLQEQYSQDYEATNYYLSNHPRSHFVSSLIAARVTAECRYALHNTQLSIHHLEGKTEKQVLNNPFDLKRTLENTFHLTLPKNDRIDEKLNHLFEQVATK